MTYQIESNFDFVYTTSKLTAHGTIEYRNSVDTIYEFLTNSNW